ncbi:hypothetical protein KKA27_03055 [Patescibacteria group bacterium]|nr:hypothetical protein [Patescibacteria group bacterium]MBU2633022.1 hypothetical protein [Patescibacteria group bacterium]
MVEKTKKLVWVTGASEVDGDEYLNCFLSLCTVRSKKVKIIYPGKMLFDAPGIPLDENNVLNAPDDHLKPKMKWVFDRIAEKLAEFFEKCDAVIIKTHRLFKWNNVYRLAHAYENVMRFNPNLMITFVDGITPILNRLGISEQFRYQGYIKKDICDWQDLEVKLTKEWAEAIKKPHFVVPSGESPELLYNLVFNPKAELTYVAIDITRSSSKLKKRVGDFVKELRKYYPCLINPFTVPLDSKNRTDEEDSHIIAMCLDWFVPQARNVVGYYPAAIQTSEGKTHEIGKAHVLTKNVWVVHVPNLDESSPFIKGFKTAPIFRTEEEFFEFLRERQKK